MTTLSEQEIQTVVAKPMQVWTEEEHYAFWQFIDGLSEERPDRLLYWRYLDQFHETRIAYIKEHTRNPNWMASNDWTIGERVSFEASLITDLPDDADLLARLEGDLCWSQVCRHSAADHDATTPSAPCQAAGCPCLFLVRPELTDRVCVCGHTMGDHTHTSCPRCVRGACQFTAAYPALASTEAAG